MFNRDGITEEGVEDVEGGRQSKTARRRRGVFGGTCRRANSGDRKRCRAGLTLQAEVFFDEL